MVAAPIYFKSSTKAEPPAAATPGTTATASSTGAGGETLVVARSEPGLRDYRRRLKKYRALDPFASGGGGEEASAASAEVTSAGGATAAIPEASSVETTVTGGESSAAAEAPRIEYPSASESSGLPAESSGGSATATTRTRYASDSIDVRIVTVPRRGRTEADEEARSRRPRSAATFPN